MTVTLTKWIFLGLIALLAIGAQGRNYVWKDNEWLWRDAIAKSPNKSRPHHNYCGAIWNSEVTRRDPNGEMQTNLKEIYRYLRESDAFDLEMWNIAKQHCVKAWRLDPKNAAINMTLGKMAMHELAWEAAEAYFQRLARTGTYKVPESWNNLGLAQAMQGKTGQACRSFRKSAEMGHEPGVGNSEKCGSHGYN